MANRWDDIERKATPEQREAAAKRLDEQIRRYREDPEFRARLDRIMDEEREVLDRLAGS